MKANELRIGNWVNNPIQNINFKVDLVALSKIYYNEQSRLDSLYKPIPITEEIILKCGFRKSHKYYLSPYGNSVEGFVDMMCFDLDELEFIVDLSEYSGYSVSIKYLHQLQNLYFALTNTELNIKL